MGRRGGTCGGARRRRSATQALSYWPAWVLEKFETASQVRRFRSDLSAVATDGDNTSAKATTAASVPAVAAGTSSAAYTVYALCNRLALSEDERQQLLAAKSVNARITAARSLLRATAPQQGSPRRGTRGHDMPTLACAACEQTLALQQHIFRFGDSAHAGKRGQPF